MADGNGCEILSDAAWAIWEPLIEEVRPRGKTPPKEMRRTISAIFWRHQNGAKWRSIPAELRPWWLVQLHYSAFLPTTSCSAPVLRFGTLVLAVGAAGTAPLATERQVLTFRTRAWLSFAPPTCRMPLGQASGISRADPGGRVTARFWHRLIRFRHFIGGFLSLSPLL